MSHVSALIFYDLLSMIIFYYNIFITFLRISYNVFCSHSLHPHKSSWIYPPPNPAASYFFAFFLSNPTPICVSHVLASMKSFAGGCQPNPSAVHARMLFFIFYRYFEVNYILCELMSTVDLSCPGSTSSEWSSLISGTYNLSVLSSVIVDLRAVVKPCTLLAQLHSAFDQL